MVHSTIWEWMSLFIVNIVDLEISCLYQRLQRHGQHLIAVIGATGLQGGAVVEALLSKGFAMRALTRDPGSVSAQRLPRAVEVCRADLSNQHSLVQVLRCTHICWVTC